MTSITSHVLDVSRGRPAGGVPVVLQQQHPPDGWQTIGQGETDADGRLRSLVAGETVLRPGVYRLVFETRRYFDVQGVSSFYPQVSVDFEVQAGETHYHVPLLVAPFGYTTYRGS